LRIRGGFRSEERAKQLVLLLLGLAPGIMHVLFVQVLLYTMMYVEVFFTGCECLACSLGIGAIFYV
jgi:hypothetical protein